MKTIIASIALLLATGTAAKEGLLWAYVQTITYDDRGAVFLTLDPEPTSRGFRCERVRFWATEARRKTMFEAVLTEQGGLRRDSIGLWLQDVPRAPAVCRVTSITIGNIYYSPP